MDVNMDLRDILEFFFLGKEKMIDFILQFYIFFIKIILKYL